MQNPNDLSGDISKPALPEKKRRVLPFFAKLTLSLMVISGVMTAGFYGLIKAEAVNTVKVERQLANQNRTITTQVNKVIIDGSMEVTLQQNAVPGLQIAAEQHVIEKINTLVDGDTLRISIKNSTDSRKPIRIALNLASLQALSLRGSGEAWASGFNGEQVSLELNGSGDVKFDGQYKNVSAIVRGSGDMTVNAGDSDKVTLELIGSGDLLATGKSKTIVTKLKGSGDLNARDLTTPNAEVELLGSGDMDVFATAVVKVNLRGSGDVTVLGNPSQREVTKHGSGEVHFN